MMRHFLLLGLSVLCVALLAACGGDPSDVPTLAVLPTEPPTDIPTIPPTDAPTAVPDAPVPTDVPQGEAVPGPEEGGAMVDSTQEPSPSFSVPTPETLDGSGGGLAGCDEADRDAVLVDADEESLNAELETQVMALRGAATTLNGWTLNDAPNAMLAALVGSMDEGVPAMSLAYQGPNNEQAMFIVAQIPAGAQDFWRECVISGASFLAQGVPTDSTATFDPVDSIDGTLIEVDTPAVGGEGTESGITLRMVLALVGDDTFIRYVETPAIMAGQGSAAASREDALALVQALVEVVGGL